MTTVVPQVTVAPDVEHPCLANADGFTRLLNGELGDSGVDGAWVQPSGSPWQSLFPFLPPDPVVLAVKVAPAADPAATELHVGLLQPGAATAPEPIRIGIDVHCPAATAYATHNILPRVQRERVEPPSCMERGWHPVAELVVGGGAWPGAALGRVRAGLSSGGCGLRTRLQVGATETRYPGSVRVPQLGGGAGLAVPVPASALRAHEATISVEADRIWHRAHLPNGYLARPTHPPTPANPWAWELRALASGQLRPGGALGLTGGASLIQPWLGTSQDVWSESRVRGEVGVVVRGPGRKSAQWPPP